jgi:hypothetical protein
VEELFRSELRDFVLRSLRLSELDLVPVPNFTIPYIKADKAPLQLRVRVGDEFLTYKSMKAIAVLRYKRKMLISKEDKKVVVLQRWFRGSEQDLPDGSRVITVRDVLFWEPETRVLFIYPGVATKTGQVDKVFNLERRAYCLIEPKVVESEGKDAKQYPVPVITPLLDQPVSLSKEFMEDLKLIQQHISWRLGLAEESPIYRTILDRLSLGAEIEEEEVPPEEEEDIAF